MTAAVLHFTPRAELTAQANLEAFVEMCRVSDVLRAREQFDKNVWDIGELKGKNGMHRAVFSSLEASKGNRSEPSMPPPFLEFAKAAVVYLQDSSPVVAQATRVAALRCLEAALRARGKGSRPTAVTVEVLDAAVDLARGQMSDAVVYRVAGQLQMLSKLMNKNGFISLRKPWDHGMRKPNELGSRISKESLQARQDKLPSAAALRALANIFRDATRASDVIVSSFAAVMLSAPERINEVVRLRRNCLVEGEGRFRGHLGLRWAGSKLADDTTKWLPSEMAPVAREAINNLLRVSEPAREIAAWYSANPGTIFLHPGAMYLRGRKLLSREEVALVLWGVENSAASTNQWLRLAGLKPAKRGPREMGRYRFEDVERAVVDMLPASFPLMPGDPHLRCEDALALLRENENHDQRPTYLCMFTSVDYGTIAMALGSTDDGRETIFSKHGYLEDDGSPLRLRSHSFRHYLNMLANVGGLSSAEIAIFSGRKDERQNRAYDHMSSEEVQAPISNALKAGFTAQLAPLRARMLVERDNFKGLGVPAAHTTEFGWCQHNFASEPCQMHRDCINCEEQTCVKGDSHREANLRRLKDETEYLLQQAREALSEQEYGADAWVKHQTLTLERVSALLAILDDPAYPPGAHVRLSIENAPLIMASEPESESKFIVFLPWAGKATA